MKYWWCYWYWLDNSVTDNWSRLLYILKTPFIFNSIYFHIPQVSQVHGFTQILCAVFVFCYSLAAIFWSSLRVPWTVSPSPSYGRDTARHSFPFDILKFDILNHSPFHTSGLNPVLLSCAVPLPSVETVLSASMTNGDFKDTIFMFAGISSQCILKSCFEKE